MAAMNSSNRKVTTLFSHVKYEHMVAGVSGGVTSTLILHPLDLIKIRFAGKCLSLLQTNFILFVININNTLFQ